MRVLKMLWLIFVVVTISLFYWLLVRPHRYWTRKGVTQDRYAFLLGDLWKVMLRMQSPPDMIEMVYRISEESRYVGIYQFWSPMLVVRDPDIIKQITIKDFDHFLDHRGFIDPTFEPLIGKNLFLLTGQKWRDMRCKLSPAFTSSKMKYMFSLMSQTGEKFVQHLLQQKQNVVTIEMKELCSKFTNDVIGNTVFGLQCDSLSDPKNEFFLLARDVSDFTTFRKMVTLMTSVLFPRLVKLLKLKLIPEEVNEFFTKIVEDNIESREEHGVVRPDMISLLLEARKNNLNHEQNEVGPDTGFATAEESELTKAASRTDGITDEDITAQAFIFFLAGFDSVSSLMGFMSYELGVNPEVQHKLIQEVDQIKEQCVGVITYEAITTMPYMDMVVSESLRKYPNAIATDRVCTKPYTIEPKLPNEAPLHLKQGDLVLMPMFAIQRDPKYYSEPDRFDPERFCEENRSKIIPYTYMPFGTGPRNCIGSKFALLETKILFYYLLSKFEIVPVERTQIPLKFNKKALNMAAEKGIWLGLKARNWE